MAQAAIWNRLAGYRSRAADVARVICRCLLHQEQAGGVVVVDYLVTNAKGEGTLFESVK